MAAGLAEKPHRESRTICLPVSEDEYRRIVDAPEQFRRWIENARAEMPELFPEKISDGFQLKDCRRSTKLGLKLRRIELRDATSWSVRPSFVMPGMIALTDDVKHPLFLRKFGVPFWALAMVFGRNHMFWYRAECALGRFSLVGTTVRKVGVPDHLLADEHHSKNAGEKQFLATTVGAGCVLGASVASSAGTEDLKSAYDVFRQEATNVQPEYTPKTVNTDGWSGTQQAWKSLFPMIIILQCFLHAWLKIRDRSKHLGELFFETGQRVWDIFRAPNKRSCSQRIRVLKGWAQTTLTGVVQDKVLDLCRKQKLWTLAFDHPDGHRTSNMLDRLMRGMNQYFEGGLHLHGKAAASEQHCRAWALLWNFAPWHPAVTQAHNGFQSPAEQLNKHRYSKRSWLEHLLVSASCNGYRFPKPHNP